MPSFSLINKKLWGYWQAVKSKRVAPQLCSRGQVPRKVSAFDMNMVLGDVANG